jgi:hypothetical protein
MFISTIQPRKNLPNTIKAFLSVKRDNFKDSKGKEVPYYSTEAYQGNPDPLGNMGNVSEKDNKTNGGAVVSAICTPLIQVNDPIYDFDNPVVRESWNITGTELNELTKKNPITEEMYDDNFMDGFILLLFLIIKKVYIYR